MKFLVIGLGSMGKRRIRNLIHIKAGEIIGVDIIPEKRAEAGEKYKIKTFNSLENALADNPDVFIISTPPNKHMEFASIAAANGKHFFTEVNVFDKLSKMENLIKLIEKKSIIAAPSSTFRYNSLIKKMKSIIDSHRLGRPLSFTYHCGQYLPDWHPWEDYRKSYASQPETAACREISVFELSWIKCMFGEISSMACVKGKLSDIDAKIDDTYHFLIRFSNDVVGHMLIDVVSRPAVREFRLVLENGTIVWDWTRRMLKVYNARSKKWQSYREHSEAADGYIAGEEMYIEEMKHFINAINGKAEYGYTFREELETIRQFFDAESADGRIGFGNDVMIDDKKIGKASPCFVIAEAGVNHNGSVEIAKKLVDAAADAGADAIKFQTFTSENLVTDKAKKAEYQKDRSGETQQEMLKRLQLSFGDFKELKKYCDKKRIIFMSTAHTEDAIDFLDRLMPAYKVGSGDLTNIPALEKIAKKGKPIILSTGMSTLEEVEYAVDAIKKYNNQIVLMHCTTRYPCPANEVNLNAMQTLKRFGFPVGYSDHTQNNLVPVLAASMGAVVVEKHLTLDRNMEGPDHRASITPSELKELVSMLKDHKKIKEIVSKADKKEIRAILGSGEKKPSKYEKKIMKVARKSIVSAMPILKGAQITRKMLAIKRPGTGIAPKHLQKIIGRTTKKDIGQDKLVRWEDLQ